MGFLDCPLVMTGRAEQSPRYLSPLANRQNHVFEHAQAPEQRGDLKSADEAALDPSGLRQMGDIGTVEPDSPGIRLQCSGNKLDKSRLAGTVWTDQRVARAAFEAKIDAVGYYQGTEVLVQPLGLECRGFHRRKRSKSPSTPPRAKITSKTIRSPTQKYQ